MFTEFGEATCFALTFYLFKTLIFFVKTYLKNGATIDGAKGAKKVNRMTEDKCYLQGCFMSCRVIPSDTSF